MVAAAVETTRRIRLAPHARPLRAWADAELQAVADTVATVWRAWLADWSAAGDPAEGRITAKRAHETQAASRQWHAFGMRAAGGAWLDGGEEQARRLVHWLLFGELPGAVIVSGGTIAQQVHDAACGELLQCLRAALGIAPDAIQSAAGDDLWHRWSGAVQLVLDCEDAELHILLDAACVEAIVGRSTRMQPLRGGLTSISHALRGQRVALRAVLEPLELSLGSLAQLRPGDILPLSHPLDADITLADADGTRVLGGFLGRADGLRALQLAPGSPAPQQLPS